MSVELFMTLYYLALTTLVVILTSWRTTKQKDTEKKPTTIYKNGILQYKDPGEALRYVLKRTAPFGVNTYGIEEFYRMWRWYFKYFTHEEVVEKLGQFKDTTINEWRAELNYLVDFSRMWSKEVWT